MREIKFRQRISNQWHYWGYIGGFFVGPITNQQPKPVNCQYTGIKDKDGVEIYEGDIVRLRSGVLCQIKWVHHGFCMFAVGDGYGSASLHESVCVIGNIYENQELLE